MTRIPNNGMHPPLHGRKPSWHSLVAPVLLSVLVLAGCNGVRATYSPLTLSADSGFQRETGQLRRELLALQPSDRLYRGMTIIDARCDRFFNDLEASRAHARFGNRQLTSLSASLPPLLEVAKASSLSVLAVSTALGFSAGALSDYDELYLLSRFSGAVYKKWQVAREDAASRIEAQIAKAHPAQMPSEYANRQLYKYSSLCLHSQLMAWLNQSAETGQIVATDENVANTDNGGGQPAVPEVKTIPDRAVSVPSYIVTAE